MISYLTGKVTKVSPHLVILDREGIGFAVRVPLSVSQRLQPHQSCTLLTVFSLPREEGEPVLYGFLEEEERQLFLSLRKVPRIGTQKSLALLSHFSPAQLIQLIQTGNASALSTVKGIGKKLAQQILLDLQSALKDLPSATLPPHYQEVYEALLVLGFSPTEARTGLEKALREEPQASAERLLQLALKSS
ncbi:MAG: Holliday junction branch migration protein RuvA [Bacteroidia bacterium]|nr:Holliday junction branch migration protein RuvA [Bacteroidia bacterium]